MIIIAVVIVHTFVNELKKKIQFMYHLCFTEKRRKGDVKRVPFLTEPYALIDREQLAGSNGNFCYFVNNEEENI
jgi:hypothetical protein